MKASLMKSISRLSKFSIQLLQSFIKGAPCSNFKEENEKQLIVHLQRISLLLILIPCFIHFAKKGFLS